MRSWEEIRYKIREREKGRTYDMRKNGIQGERKGGEGKLEGKKRKGKGEKGKNNRRW